MLKAYGPLVEDRLRECNATMVTARNTTVPVLVLTCIMALNVTILLLLLTPSLQISLSTGAIFVIAAVEAVTIYLIYSREKRNAMARDF